MPTLLHHLLENAAAAHPGKEAVVDKDRRFDYSEFAAAASTCAAVLRERGLQRRDRVAIFLDKSFEECVAIFGASMAGGVFVPINALLPGQYNVLIDQGVLKAYMQDKLNARLMGVAPTGNGRRESFAHIPMPRMTNTYMLPGPHDPEEIIASVDKGIFAPNFGGGQVDITSGKFVFSASEAYLIEKGKIGAPVKGAMLIGDGPEALSRISMVGNDLELDRGVGTCGKDGQSVPVGVGQPTLKIDEITVGGTS